MVCTKDAEVALAASSADEPFNFSAVTATVAVVSAACAGSRQYLVSSLSITPGGRRQPQDVFNTRMKSSGKR